MTLDETTIALLTSWTDYFPFPETWTAQLQRRNTKPGPPALDLSRPIPASSRLECKTCGGTCWVGKRLCGNCGGKGWFPGDAYTEQRVNTNETTFEALLRQQVVTCDGCGGWGRLSAYANQEPTKDHAICEKCMGTGKVSGAFTGVCRPFRVDDERERIGDAGLDGMAREHERRDDVDVYRLHLEPAMVELRVADRGAHFLVSWVYVVAAETRASLREPRRFLLDSAVTYLSSRLPLDSHGRVAGVPSEIYAGEVHRQAALVRAKGCKADKYAQRGRDAEIRHRYATGNYTMEELGAYFGIDKSRVSRIVSAA